MSPLDKQFVNEFNTLEKDRTYQDKQSVTFALNTIKDSHDGGQPEYQSEPGNILSQTIPTGHTIVGTIYGQSNEIYVFSTDGTDSSIGMFREDTYQELVSAPLNFNTNYPITGEYRIRNNCNRTIYWCDYLNNDRWFDIDNPDSFKTSGTFDPNKFNFSPDIKVPFINLVSVNDSGGNLNVGSYYFQVELLDASENVIYKSDISPQTPIYDESSQTVYHQIDGAVNYPQYDQLAGGVPSTNKSISLRFDNLDTKYKYLRVKVAYQTTANGVVQAHQVGELIPISSTSINWTYRGYNTSAGDSPIDYTSMLIDPINYQSCYVMEQVQNRLIRANLKEKTRDYSNYQLATNEITSRWVASECDAFKVTTGNPKAPSTYWYKTSFQGDEIYAFGIRYLHKDGSYSPVFFISGRQPISEDYKLLTVVDNIASLGSDDVWLSDVEHLGLSIGDTVETWKVFNTATITESHTDTHPYSYAGEFGYYVADFVYPDITDCDGNSIWGSDDDANVRFHRFPDRKLIPHIDGEQGEYILPLGVEFTVPTYPNSDVIGHQFCYIPRDEFNKTVTDSGWAGRASHFADDVVYIGTMPSYSIGNVSEKPTLTQFYSSQTTFQNKVASDDFLKRNQVYHFESTSITNNTNLFAAFEKLGGNQLFSLIYKQTNVFKQLFERTNYKINLSYIGSPRSIASGILSESINNRSSLHYASLYNLGFQLDGESNLAAPFGAYFYDVPDNSSDNRVTRLDMISQYCYVKKLQDVYQNFVNASYKYLNNNPILGTGTSELYNGDTLIVQNLQMFSGYSPETEFHIYLPDGTRDITYAYLHTNKMWEEQQFNSSLRYEGLSPEFTYYQIGDTDESQMLKFASKDSNGDFNPYAPELVIPDYFKLNSDYTPTPRSVSKFGLPSNYDYCSKCEGIYTNRIVFSPKSFDEEKFDLYRQTLVNDYIDIPGHRGKITGLKYRNNSLIVHCEDATFILQPNPQVIATDQIQAYLTTGDFLSIPPIELLQTDIGFAGCQNKQHQCNTPFGHCWIDQRRGQVFKYDNQLEEMTNGLSQWFKEYLPSEMQKNMWTVKGISYPFPNTPHELGIGCILYYDPRFKRLLLSKIDYLPIGHADRSGGSGLYFNTTLNRWEIYVGGSLTGIPQLNNTTYFENKSWTLSFDFKYNGWVSWHSYIPYISFSDDFNYYTSPRFQTDQIYKHLDKTNYQKYYGTKYDMVLEYMSFDLSSDRLFAIHYQGSCHEWDNTNKQWLERDKTFDRFVCYNKNQSTGLQSLILQDQHINPYQNTYLPNDTKYVIKTNQDYKISGIYDMSTGQPVNTSDWQFLKLQVGYIDQIVKASNINFNKSQYEWSDMWDKYVTTRLFYKPTEDYKKTVILTETNEQISQR